MNGLVSYNYIIEKLSLKEFLFDGNIPKLQYYNDREYGAFYEVLSVFIEKILSLNDTKDIYLFRHFFNSLFFFIAGLYFFFYFKKV